jgi:hypothetical protein
MGDPIGDHEMLKMIRDQQKAGLAMVYKDFAKRLNLSPEQSENLTELLADNVMDNVDLITAVLRDGKTPEEREWLFARQEAILLEKVQALLGPDVLADHQDYTRDVLGHISAEQFKGKLSGDSPAKDEKSRQLSELLRQETQAVLHAAGLEPDFQIVPTLNFRNFVSEEEAERNLKLLDAIYENAAARAVPFLSPEEIQSLHEFREAAINGNRMVLTVNRKMMAPGGN